MDRNGHGVFRRLMSRCPDSCRGPSWRWRGGESGQKAAFRAVRAANHTLRATTPGLPACLTRTRRAPPNHHLARSISSSFSFTFTPCPSLCPSRREAQHHHPPKKVTGDLLSSPARTGLFQQWRCLMRDKLSTTSSSKVCTPILDQSTLPVLTAPNV